MKKLRIIFIILSITWMVVVFLFSNEPSDESKNTSSFVTKIIANIIYGDNLPEKELTLKIQELDPIIRKLAHYTLYAIGGFLICSVISTYDISIKRNILISQGIGSIYAITDEIHQYFIPRKKCKDNRRTYRLSGSTYRHNISIDFT